MTQLLRMITIVQNYKRAAESTYGKKWQVLCECLFADFLFTCCNSQSNGYVLFFVVISTEYICHCMSGGIEKCAGRIEVDERGLVIIASNKLGRAKSTLVKNKLHFVSVHMTIVMMMMTVWTFMPITGFSMQPTTIAGACESGQSLVYNHHTASSKAPV